MKRLVLAVLILATATLTVPPLRDRADPHLDRFRESLGEKLEGPLSPVLNPYRRLRSESEIGEVVRRLIADRNVGLLRPEPDQFRDYIQREVRRSDGLDGWGTPYILVPEQDSVAIISAGPDLEYETDDDIVVKIRYGTPAYMPRRRQ
jgi:hypothetical protein